MARKKILVILINYFSERLTNKVLTILKKYSFTNVIVIDNGSISRINVTGSDNSLIKLKKNIGFANATNLAIKKGMILNPDYFLLLNPDVTNFEQIFYSRKIGKYDISSPVIKNRIGNDEYVYDYGGRVNMLLGRARHIHKKDFLNISADSNPDYVSGCSMLISSKLFKQGFLFDPDYFLYWEDVDFCLRAKKKRIFCRAFG